MTKRYENETQQDYRTRRANEQLQLKEVLKGRVIWDSSRKGIYVKSKHGELV